MTDQTFFILSIPSSRPADYYLGYMEGSVFMDFKNYDSNKVALIRISFDGYGCCELGNDSVPLNQDDSRAFKDIIQRNIDEQSALLTIVRKVIELNKKMIWKDALKEYHLV